MSDYSVVYTCPKQRNQTNFKIMIESNGETQRVFCHLTEHCSVGFITGHNAAIHCPLYGKHWQQHNSLYYHTD